MERQKLRKIMQIVSFLALPIIFYYFLPILSIQGLIKGVISASIIIFFSLFILSFFFGRLFCSYLCPFGAFQDICATINNKKIDPRTNWIKYLFFTPWIIFILLIPFIINPLYKGIRFFYETENHIPYGFSLTGIESYIIYYGFLLIIFLLCYKYGRRSFCTHLCWIAPFMIAGRYIRNYFLWPSLHLKAERDRCTDCKTCIHLCPKSLNVHSHVKRDNMEDLECILCGMCVDNCPQKLIKYNITETPYEKSMKKKRKW